MVTGAAAEEPPDGASSASPPHAAVTLRARAVAVATASILPRRDLSIIPDPSQVVSRISWEVASHGRSPTTALWERSHEESSISDVSVNMPKHNRYTEPKLIISNAYIQA
ncbi:hypothetical protein GCM10023193_68720 [Planotetraspora kaengkrachanensis]|uniref:Uncharacterized protein n=1 Tax=Planotetraspora kaengkrachanensis TaxID=575193 RepID=A0A8J3PYB5_9ACTN|nr:hypothetical protein Pka01_63840 [Planotetraspora kaengkrachanensis]